MTYMVVCTPMVALSVNVINLVCFAGKACRVTQLCVFPNLDPRFPFLTLVSNKLQSNAVRSSKVQAIK